MFITEIIAGIAIGILLAVPPGPIGVTAIKLALDEGKKHGVHLAYGNWIMDTIYCIIATFTTSAAVSTLSAFNVHHPFIILFIQLIIISGFIVAGIINLKKSKQLDKLKKLPKENSILNKYISYLKSKGPFLLGIAIALTNMANPTFLPSLAAVAVQAQAIKLIDNSLLSNLIFSIGFGFGNFLWIYFLVVIVIKFKDKLGTNFMVRIKQFAGITFISCGTLLGYRVIAVTPWNELLRLATVF